MRFVYSRRGEGSWLELMLKRRRLALGNLVNLQPRRRDPEIATWRWQVHLKK